MAHSIWRLCQGNQNLETLPSQRKGKRDNHLDRAELKFTFSLASGATTHATPAYHRDRKSDHTGREIARHQRPTHQSASAITGEPRRHSPQSQFESMSLESPCPSSIKTEEKNPGTERTRSGNRTDGKWRLSNDQTRLSTTLHRNQSALAGIEASAQPSRMTDLVLSIEEFSEIAQRQKSEVLESEISDASGSADQIERTAQ